MSLLGRRVRAVSHPRLCSRPLGREGGAVRQAGGEGRVSRRNQLGYCLLCVVFVPSTCCIGSACVCVCARFDTLCVCVCVCESRAREQRIHLHVEPRTPWSSSQLPPTAHFPQHTHTHTCPRSAAPATAHEGDKCAVRSPTRPSRGILQHDERRGEARRGVGQRANTR